MATMMTMPGGRISYCEIILYKKKTDVCLRYLSIFFFCIHVYEQQLKNDSKGVPLVVLCRSCWFNFGRYQSSSLAVPFILNSNFNVQLGQVVRPTSLGRLGRLNITLLTTINTCVKRVDTESSFSFYSGNNPLYHKQRRFGIVVAVNFAL